MKKLGILLALFATGAIGTAMAAATSPPFTECPTVGSATSCDVLITVNANGSATVALDSTQPPYDNVEDSLVGVLNNSAHAIGALPLSGSDIFGLEGDGMCSFGAAGNCSMGISTTDPYDYTGDFVTFSITDVNTGVVNFVGGLAPGASTFFSLEGLPTANIVVGPPTSGTPEPATYGLMGMSGLLLLGLSRFRRRAALSRS